MKSKAGRGLTFKFRKAVIISAIALPLVYAGCKKDNSPPEASLVVTPISGVHL